MKKKFSINDPIHNRITLTDIEQSVISHSIYQRLRRIKALGLLEKVFPSARHSRFEHSIGACHISGEILTALIQNYGEISDLSKWNLNGEFKPWSGLVEFLTESRIQQIKLAALLHDVGHGPFSHASEEIMPLRAELTRANALPEYLVNALNKRTESKKSKKKERPEYADHEDYSLILAWRILTDTQKNHAVLNDDYVNDVLAFKFEFVEPSNSAFTGNKIIFDLFRNFIDGEFDSDRMDYLLRDSYFCGVPYGRFDLIRLLEGLYLLENIKTKELVLGLKKSSLSAFEDFLFARFQMHSQVYSHRVDAAFNSALTSLSLANDCKLPPEIEKYAEVDDECFLFSPHLAKPTAHLRQLLLDREMWSMIFETVDKKDKRPEEIAVEINNKIGKGLCSVSKSKREFRNPDVLRIPIVISDDKRNFSTERLDRIALILNSYETTFFTRRVFVHPHHDHVDIAMEIKKQVMNDPKRTASINQLIANKKEEISNLENSGVSPEKVGENK